MFYRTLVLILLCGIAQAADPVLFFSDINSGPRTGNSDISGGRTGQDGAIVTVWGLNLGSTVSDITIYCNGAQAASYYFFGNATAPADLYSRQNMQMVSFQINHLAQDGAGGIYAVVNGIQSNTLPFTIRPGSIYFVKTTGHDSTGIGSWSNPWQTIPKSAGSMSPGDISYIGNGVNQTTETEFSAAVNLGSDGSAGNPKALIVYPGATSQVGNASIERAFHNYNGNTDSYSAHWVVAKFRITTGTIGVNAQTGFRVVGNYITAPNGNGMDGAIHVLGSNVFVFGNELTGVGAADCSKLYHTIYLTGVRLDSGPRAPTESNRQVAWNHIHDNNTNRAVNVYSEQDYSAFIQQHSIHDNVIVNQHGDGILLGYYVTGENWIYNNLIIQAGLGPEWSDDASYHTGIRINTGHETLPPTTVHVYNNTLYGCGWSGAVYSEESGHVLISPEALNRSTVNFSNNIITSTGEPYVAAESGAVPAAGYTNCWYGDGTAPSWDNTAISGNPDFVNAAAGDFQLQSGSPCIDAGLDVSTVVSRDLLGITRPQGGSFDLGSYEYAQPVLGITATPSSMIFGNITTGSSSTPGALTVSNTGGNNILVGSIAVSGPSSSDFAVQNDQVSFQTLPPAQSRNLEVVFTPGAAGLRTASLTIPSDDPNMPVLTVPLQGTGVSPALWFDTFDDGDASDWTPTKGTWTVISGDLTGTFSKKADIIAPFAGCRICSIETDLRVDTAGARASLLAWDAGKPDMVEILMMQDKNRWMLKVRAGGTVVIRMKAARTIIPGTNYHVTARYDGSSLQISVDGIPILNASTTAIAWGRVGFRLRSTISAPVTIASREIFAYP
jgi:hypothetical protein